jgi:hypothetical protein
MQDRNPIRWAIVIALVVGSSFVAWDAYLFFTRTSAMAPVGLGRLTFSLLLQALSVFGFSSFAFPATSRIRKLQSSFFRGGAFFPAVFGLVLGAALAAGALHYSNCERWGMNGGSFCTPYP